MIQISVSYSWPTYQHYSNATAHTSCYLTVGLVPHGLCSTSIILGIVLGSSAAECRGLLFVYSLSGCDLTPSFFGVGKLNFFDLYISNTLTEEDLKVFKDLSSGPTTLTDKQLNRVAVHTCCLSNQRGSNL